ncbi:MAG: NAD(P)/FAD-dependent oxidoreductase [Polynucleobacter sp.]
MSEQNQKNHSKQAPIKTDALVIGAGPIGLFAIFQLGLQGIKAHVIDTLPHAGGQCAELYPDKPIYDIPGIPYCTGAELVNNLLEQIKPMNATFHWSQEVSGLTRQPNAEFEVSTAHNTFITKTILLATGVGAFKPKKLAIDGIDALIGSRVFYHPQNLSRFKDLDVVIYGGDESAINAAIELTNISKSVTLIYRRDVLKGPNELIAKYEELRASGRVIFKAGQITNIHSHNQELKTIAITSPEGTVINQPLDALLVFLGISPKLGPIADWGVNLERKQVPVDTAKFQTNVPGIFAIGDINTYPGKRKLIVSGFHEATLAAFACAELIHPNEPVLLQYTTTSTKLHEILGVSGKAQTSN